MSLGLSDTLNEYHNINPSTGNEHVEQEFKTIVCFPFGHVFKSIYICY